MSHPAGQNGGHECAGVRRRVEEADGARAAAEVRAVRREEGHRHPEDHRIRVDEEDPEQRLLRPDETEALDDGPEARPLGVLGRRQGGQAPHAPERGAEGSHVEDVRERQTDRGDEQAGRGGPGDGAEVAVDALERVRGRELLVADEPRQERAHRGRPEAEDRRRQGLRRKERPHLRMRKQGVPGEEQ